jgi:hypothetical protein
MKHQAGVIISILILAGCAQDYLATGLPRLQGQPVSQAVHYLGPPTEQKKADGRTTYTWVNNQSGTFYVPDTASQPVVVQNGGHPALVFAGSSPPPMPDTYNWHCRLDITAEKGVISHTTYEGDAAGCQVFSEKLKPLAMEAEGK